MDLTPTDRALADALLTVPGVVAVAVGGSRASGFADAASDTDLYAFHAPDVPDLATRADALRHLADGEVDNDSTWGDENRLHVAGHLVEVIWFGIDGLGLDAADDPGLAPNGYTTAVLHTVATCVPVADPSGWLAAQQARLRTYPEATRRRLIAQSPYELDGYLEQLHKAQSRRDWTSVTNRRSALQACWFDLLFALNRRYHPGEKRLLVHTGSLPLLPVDAVERWSSASLAPADDPALLPQLEGLVADLVALSAGSR